MNNRYQNRSNFRSDNPRGYQSGFQPRKGWTDRSKAQYEPHWRSDNRDFKESRNANRNDGRQQSGQSTHLPGIPVNRNQSSTPFVSNDPKVDVCANGSGDQICDQKPVDSLYKQMSELDLNPKDPVIQTEVTATETKEVDDSSVSETPTPSEIKMESKPEAKDETKEAAFSQRRNSVGSEYRVQNYRTFRRNDNMSGIKFERFNHQNKLQTNDPNKRFNNRAHKKFPPLKSDFSPNYVPMNPYVSNMCDPYPPFSPYLIPNPYYSSAYCYGTPSPMPSNCGDVTNELGTRKQTETERSNNHSESTPQIEMSRYATHFVPFEPSPAFPIPPTYYGNIIPCKGETGGMYYFYQSVMPPNIALLPLEIDAATNQPILPSNCYTLNY